MRWPNIGRFFRAEDKPGFLRIKLTEYTAGAVEGERLLIHGHITH
jgi:hypothetical protein